MPLALTSHHISWLSRLYVTASDTDLDTELLMNRLPRRPSTSLPVLMNRRKQRPFVVRPQLLTR